MWLIKRLLTLYLESSRLSCVPEKPNTRCTTIDTTMTNALLIVVRQILREWISYEVPTCSAVYYLVISGNATMWTIKLFFVCLSLSVGGGHKDGKRHVYLRMRRDDIPLMTH